MRNILILIILVSGLIFTSLIKNKTRLLEKELVYLHNEINSLSSSLSEATLDFQYLTTPKHISLLAKDFLDENFSYYKEYQIKKLIKLEKDLVVELNEKNSNLSKKIDTEIAGDAFAGEETVKYLAILKKLKNNNTISQFSTEESINKNSNSVKKIDNRQSQEPKEILVSKKVNNWMGIQIIKSLFGVPTIPIK